MRVVMLGIGLALAVALPAALLAQVLDSMADKGDTPTAVLALVPVVLAGMVLGGWVVGQRAPTRPVSSGGLAGLVAIAVVLALGAARRMVADEEVAWAGATGVVLVGALLGAGGAALGRRHPARPRP